MKRAYMVVLEIEPVSVGTVYVALPLHCTVVHWFRSDCVPAQIGGTIEPIIRATQPLHLVSSASALFGLDQDIPVNVLEENLALRNFHHALLDGLKTLGVEHTHDEWVAAGYRPHVTRQRSGFFEVRRTHLARRAYLVEAMIPETLQQKKIISKIVLQGTS